jgi:hypothetical protein
MSSEPSNFTLDLQQLAEARIKLHYAIQPLAATSFALGIAQPDFSHMSLQWDRFGFVTQPLTALQSYRVTLDPNTLTLGILGNSDRIISVFPLSDRKLSDAFDWVRQAIKGLGGSAELIVPIDYPPDDFPSSNLADGATFAIQGLTSILADYYAIADRLLKDIVLKEPTASPVRIWPHHFDIATLIALPNEANGEAKTIGIGLSPGDRSYGEPYWYVTPYPYPKDREHLPNLDGGGFWHAEYWVGAVLTASQFGEPEASIDQLSAFLNSAIAGCKKLLNP